MPACLLCPTRATPGGSGGEPGADSVDEVTEHRPTNPIEARAAHRLLSRRTVLAGGLSLVTLAACGSSGSSTSSPGTAGTSDAGASLLGFFDQNGELTVGRPQRAVVGLGDASGALLDKTPATLTFELQLPDGKTQKLTVERHNTGLPRAYYPVTFTPEAAGTYTLSTRYAAQDLRTTFTVADTSPIPAPGAAMPKLHTPTMADPLGMDPICTNDPVCPLHDISLDAALTQQRPVAYLISTPKFCQVAICGPVLDVLLGMRDAYRDRITFIHQEVYENGVDAAEHGNAAKLAPPLVALGLTFEPLVFLIGADGVIKERLDHIYDETELRRGLDALLR